METGEPVADEEKQASEVRRRGFLGLIAGLVVGGAAGALYHLLAPPKEVERLTTKTITEAQTVMRTETVRATERITETQTVPATEVGKTTYTVKIKVVRTPRVKDLWPEGLPIKGTWFESLESFCPLLIEGQEFEVKPGEPPRMPSFFCPDAWENLVRQGDLFKLGCGEDFPQWFEEPGVLLTLCPDPARPVAFLLQRV